MVKIAPPFVLGSPRIGQVEQLAGRERKAQLARVQIARQGASCRAADRNGAGRAAKNDQRGVDTRAGVLLADAGHTRRRTTGVLDEEAADVRTVFIPAADVHNRRGSRRKACSSRILREEAATFVVAEDVAVELVRTALGDGVDRAARQTAVLGRQTTGHDFNFLYEVRIEALALLAKADRGRVQTVDDVLVLGA